MAKVLNKRLVALRDAARLVNVSKPHDAWLGHVEPAWVGDPAGLEMAEIWSMPISSSSEPNRRLLTRWRGVRCSQDEAVAHLGGK